MENEEKEINNEQQNNITEEDVKKTISLIVERFAFNLKGVLPAKNIGSIIVSVTADSEQYMTYVGDSSSLAANITAMLEDENIELPVNLAYMAMASKKCQKYFKNNEEQQGGDSERDNNKA